MGKQLWLQDAGSPVEMADFEEHDIQVPLELQLDPEMPGEAQAAWGIMRGVGKRAQASLKVYAERAGWTEARFKKWQQVVVQAGWMVLMAEGVGNDDGKGTPRLWWMCRKKGEQPPITAYKGSDNRGGGGEGDGFEGASNSEGSKKRTPKQGSSSNLSSPSKTPAPEGADVPRGTGKAKKPPYQTTDGHTSPQLVEAWAQGWAWQRMAQRVAGVAKPTTLEALTPIERDDLQAHLKRGMRQLLDLGHRESFKLEEFSVRADNMRHHDFHQKQDCSLTYFCSHYPEFANGHKQLKTAIGKRYSGQSAEQRNPDED